MFARLLTSYTNRHTKISSSFASRCSYVYLHTTASDTTRLAEASHLDVRTSTYWLHNKISRSLAYRCSHVYLHPTAPNTARLAAVSHLDVRTSTYPLHQQTHQN